MGSKQLRVVRGGSYFNESRNVRCAYRNRNNPDNRNDNIGFRVVAATFFMTAGTSWWGRQPSQAEAKNGGARSWPRQVIWPGI